MNKILVLFRRIIEGSNENGTGLFYALVILNRISMRRKLEKIYTDLHFASLQEKLKSSTQPSTKKAPAFTEGFQKFK